MTGYQSTSLEAYAGMTPAALNDRQRAVLRAIRELGAATNQEISQYLGWPINTVTPRVLELRALEVVRYMGSTRITPTHRKAMLWGTNHL